jgi:HAD superfamily hydrolase (TIGR01459 family)
VSNSPRTAEGVELQLNSIGVPRTCYDASVTSGDVTRSLMLKHGNGLLYHLGPERDISLFRGLPVSRVPLAEASAVVCTGFFHEERETVADYAEALAEMKERGLVMICANPDREVRKGNHIYPCAGSLAAAYQERGGIVAMAGKPFPPIYGLALAKAEVLRGMPVGLKDILAIGDGPATDVLGAADFGIPVVLVAGGINGDGDDLEGLQERVQRQVPHARILATVASLAF